MKGFAGGEQRRMAAVFLVVSLGLFLGCILLSPGPAARVAARYMDAAVGNDYMALYQLFDPTVLAEEMERSGMDQAGLERVARANAALVEQYIAGIEGDYSVTFSCAYAVAGEETLDADRLENLNLAYAAEGYTLDLLDAREVTVRAAATLTGEGGAQTLERDLVLTVLRTPRGWSLDRDSMYAYWNLLYALPNFAAEHIS